MQTVEKKAKADEQKQTENKGTFPLKKKPTRKKFPREN
jgi:hypothetical protein